MHSIIKRRDGNQLKQNTTKAKILFYGSYMESDPVKIVVEGMDLFKQENYDLIIVDTSRHRKQEASLFEEMRQVSEATKPDLVIFVMNNSIGQAQAFKQSVLVGAAIITKMDGHAKGGGALSVVAATKSPVIFIRTGEHMDEFEIFDVKPFVSQFLGMGDWSGFMDKIHEVVPMDQQPELQQKLSEGHFTLRIMYEQFQNILKMGPIGQVFSMLSGLSSVLMPKGREKERQAKIKGYITVIDSMTNKELDSSSPKIMNDSQRCNGNVRRVQAPCQDLGKNEGTQDAKEGSNERIVSKYECTTHEQSSSTTDAHK
ncbi:hypothetical protein GIB67_017036 [Kingdonia uniflora]|uniref:SRP54-type proteins GTP-binding domain-containing protein n=1 Tax=Kingdonia uniflora TaxID=39325 RepID=A0A7J7NCM4_9MAGN|nr:hypothetical protein GIB67_017036 [Kingdonia uniflora]